MAEALPDIAHRIAHMRGMAQRTWDRGEFFFYVRISEPPYPEERGAEYEEPLAEMLRAGCHWRLAAREAAINEYSHAFSSSQGVIRCLSARC